MPSVCQTHWPCLASEDQNANDVTRKRLIKLATADVIVDWAGSMYISSRRTVFILRLPCRACYTKFMPAQQSQALVPGQSGILVCRTLKMRKGLSTDKKKPLFDISSNKC